MTLRRLAKSTHLQQRNRPRSHSTQALATGLTEKRKEATRLNTRAQKRLAQNPANTQAPTHVGTEPMTEGCVLFLSCIGKGMDTDFLTVLIPLPRNDLMDLRFLPTRKSSGPSQSSCQSRMAVMRGNLK